MAKRRLYSYFLLLVMSFIVLHDIIPHRHILNNPLAVETKTSVAAVHGHSHSHSSFLALADCGYCCNNYHPYHKHEHECNFSHTSLLVVDRLSSFIPSTGIMCFGKTIKTIFNSYYSTSKILKGFSLVFKLRGPPFILS